MPLGAGSVWAALAEPLCCWAHSWGSKCTKHLVSHNSERRSHPNPEITGFAAEDLQRLLKRPFLPFLFHSFHSLACTQKKKKWEKKKTVLQVIFLSPLVAFKPTMSPSDTEQRSGSSVTWSWNCWPWQILSSKERPTAGKFWGQSL